MSGSEWRPAEPYRPRATHFEGVRELGGWQVKSYGIAYDRSGSADVSFDGAWSLAARSLPSPARTVERDGVGFAIAHRGRGIDYFVLAWWDRENELPLRVFVRYRGTGQAWRPATGSESVCVWDLEIIGFERDAYVATMLTSAPDPAAYLGRHA